MCGTSLEFRATVAFLLDGVPHHVVGAWQPSKQLAKRDAAERTLSLYVGHWGDLAVKDRDAAAVERDALGVTLTCNGQHCSNGSLATQNEIKLLEGYCGKITSNNKSQPQWSHKWEENGLGLCQAFVEVKLCDVSHTFAGKPCQDQEAAYRDTARRVLWYLQCPGFEEIMEPDADYVRTAAHAIPEPSSSWTKDDDSEGEERQLAERKTTIMRVQNRLQQAFARQLEAVLLLVAGCEARGKHRSMLASKFLASWTRSSLPGPEAERRECCPPICKPKQTACSGRDSA
jgi:hypothetical protein